MSGLSTIASRSAFRIKRPVIATNGFDSGTDPSVKKLLDELETLLGKRIFKRSAAQGAEGDKPRAAGDAKAVSHNGNRLDGMVAQLLKGPLTPKHAPAYKETGQDGATLWNPDSLAAKLSAALVADGNVTLSEYIDMTPVLSALKYAFTSTLREGYYGLDNNTKAVIDDRPAVVDYLIAYGYVVMSLEDVNGLKNFVLNNRLGVQTVTDYAAVSAARGYVADQQLKVDHYNADNSLFARKVIEAKLPLSKAGFTTKLHSLVQTFMFDADELELIDAAGFDGIKPEMKPALVRMIKSFNKSQALTLDKTNIKFFLPQFISQISSLTASPEDTTGDEDTADSDEAFAVDFLEDDDSMVQISRTALLCASQLFYSMVLGDELAVFDVVNYFTHKYLVRGEIELSDPQLRDDLQMYVFSNRFTDLRTNKIADRTRPAERQMFYRQVFNYGSGRVTDDVIVNTEFTKLWKVLVLESAKYIERAQASFDPDSYVSRQNVMQAVEDLQYNLSSHCTGMATVISPLIYAELNFIMRRILMHPEVRSQVVPSGATWWRVVETLYAGMRHRKPKANVLYTKAKVGHDIMASIADYNPSSFEEDGPFSKFISLVEAFITTQSILQDALTDDLKKTRRRYDARDDEENEDDAPPYSPRAVAPSADDDGEEGDPMNSAPAGNGNAAATDDEWDF